MFFNNREPICYGVLFVVFFYVVQFILSSSFFNNHPLCLYCSSRVCAKNLVGLKREESVKRNKTDRIINNTNYQYQK